jgi:hypothetical protein
MTGRPRDLLTLADLRALARIVDTRPTTLVAAAQLVGFDRTRLTRLIGRVNAQIGEDVSWRHEGRFSPPIEARRIAAAYLRFERTLDEVCGSPRISAGTTLSVILLRLIGRRGQTLDQPLAILRSGQVLAALQEDRVDIAIVSSEAPVIRDHGITFSARGDSRPVGAGIEAMALAPWTAQRIRRRRQGDEDAKALLAIIDWEPGSTGAELGIKAGLAPATRGVRVRCRSFLEAMDLVRFGAAAEAVVPDIYLLHREDDFFIEATPNPVTGYLVALYRDQDRERWQWLWERDFWAALDVSPLED